MRWKRASGATFLEMRTGTVNGTVEGAFRRFCPGFCRTKSDATIAPVV
jgi:hypothetical protein